MSENQNESADTNELQHPGMAEQIEQQRDLQMDVTDHHGVTPFVPPANADGTWTLTTEQLNELLNVTRVMATITHSKAVYDTLKQMDEDPEMDDNAIIANLAWLSAVTTNESVDHMNRCMDRWRRQAENEAK